VKRKKRLQKAQKELSNIKDMLSIVVVLKLISNLSKCTLEIGTVYFVVMIPL
jgi:hypothetical protein